VKPARRHTRRYAGIVIALAAAATAVLVLLVAPARTTPKARLTAQTPRPRGFTIASPDRGSPLSAGVAVTLAEARAAVDFPVPVPATPASGSSNLSSVWLDKEQDAVGLVFGGGSLSVVMYRNPQFSPATFFPTFIAQNDSTATLTQVAGNLALAISGDSDYSQSNPAFVQFDVRGVIVEIFSHAYSTAPLLAAGASLAQQANCAPCTQSAGAQHMSQRLNSRSSSHALARVTGRMRASRAVRARYTRPPMVRIFSPSGLAFASKYLRSWSQPFSFDVPSGHYKVFAPAQDHNGSVRNCEVKRIEVRARQVVHLNLGSRCLNRSRSGK
jgi:hypothetical protein